MSESELSSYDEVPYSSYPYSKSHPRNLAVQATLFGMNPASINECRILEIGCASGGNVIPIAAQYPGTEVVGIDASERQVEDGCEVIRQLELKNITLKRLDVMDFESDAGQFDYIICHGVYSWVPPEVQRKILAVCRDHLSPQGVAYVSYNTYPGWYLRRGVREMMSYHASGFDDTQTRINQSRALVDFLAKAVESSGDAYEMLLREELSILRSSEDSYLFHEHLEEHNEPLFFHQFVTRAEDAKLRFLSEANFGTMVANDHSAETQATLSEVAPNIIQMEQYLDFLRNRRFRQTLLCHESVEPIRAIDAERLANLSVSAPLTRSAGEDGVDDRLGYRFTHPSGRTATVATANQDAAFAHLGEIWPADISAETLAEEAWASTPRDLRTTREASRQEILETLLECYSSGLVDLFARSIEVETSVGETPKVDAYVRSHAAAGRQCVANRRHETTNIDALDREILKRLDGETRQETIVEALAGDDRPIDLRSEDQSRATCEQIAEAVEKRLEHYAKSSLLIVE